LLVRLGRDAGHDSGALPCRQTHQPHLPYSEISLDGAGKSGLIPSLFLPFLSILYSPPYPLKRIIAVMHLPRQSPPPERWAVFRSFVVAICNFPLSQTCIPILLRKPTSPLLSVPLLPPSCVISIHTQKFRFLTP